MKKALSILCVLALCFALAGCGGGGTSESQAAPAPSAGGESSQAAESGGEDGAPESTAAGSSDVQVGLIIEPGGLGDKSVNDQAYAGLQRAEAELGVATKLMEPNDAGQFLDMNQKLADAGYQLVVNNAFSMADAVAEAADAYPEVRFLILDTVVEKDNVISATYQTHEGSFLAGAVAAMKSESGTIGFVGGMKIPTIERYEVGFTEGAQYINPDIKVIPKYIGNDGSAWNDAPKGKSLAEDLASNGADVVFHAAGGSGLGVIEGCKGKGIWAIGVNVDQTDVAPETVLTSMLTRGDNAVFQVAEATAKGTEVDNHLVMDLTNDGVGLVDSQHFDDEIRTAVEDITAKIISGEIVVTDAMA